VLHDESLRRVQGVAANISTITAREAGESGVPTLAEVFHAVGPSAFVDVELKQWVPGVLEVLEAARGANLEQAAISSFDITAMRNIGLERPAWRRWLNSVALDSDVISRALDLGCAGIAAQWRSINARSATAAAAAGLELIGWTVRRRPTYRRLERLGVFAICAEALALDG